MQGNQEQEMNLAPALDDTTLKELRVMRSQVHP